MKVGDKVIVVESNTFGDCPWIGEIKSFGHNGTVTILSSRGMYVNTMPDYCTKISEQEYFKQALLG